MKWIQTIVIGLLVSLSCGLSASPAAAEELSKEACVEAHSRGQDAREQGKVTIARRLFVSCAQASCPNLVQNDCARFADELERARSMLSFGARDSSGRDLPDTSLYVDGELLATRLDDGKSHEIDPGKHTLRFVNDGREQVLSIVVTSGEKGRTVVGTFESTTPPAPIAGVPPSEVETTHALGARLLLGAGAGLTVAGAALGIVGLVRMPSACSLKTHECASPPGDSSFHVAAEAVRMSDIGFVAAGVGMAALATGIVWYFKSAQQDHRDSRGARVGAWAMGHGAGLSFSGRL